MNPRLVIRPMDFAGSARRLRMSRHEERDLRGTDGARQTTRFKLVKMYIMRWLLYTNVRLMRGSEK